MIKKKSIILYKKISPSMEIYDGIAADLGGCDFMHPYFLRRFRRTANGPAPRAAIKIVSHPAPVAASREFDTYCEANSLPVTTLICPEIIGTGMTGLPMRIARGIYRGTYTLIADNATRLSVVHALDVADAAALAAGTQGSFTITDGDDPTINDLSDALAYRISAKRLFSLPVWASKIWLGSKMFGKLTTDNVIADTFRLQFPDFSPRKVTHYLRTHDYAAD